MDERPCREDVSGSGAVPETDWTTINPQAMVERPGPILRWLGRAFFGSVAFDEGSRRTIREAASRGTPVYVLYVRSLLDLLYFNHAFVVWSLPLVFFAAGLNLLLFRPIGEVARYMWRRLVGPRRRRLSDRDRMRHALSQGRACLISLKRPHSLIQWGDDDRLSHLRDLIAVQREVGHPVVLIPLLVVWDKKPESYRRTITDVVFGDPQAPGALRKAVSFFLNFRRARAQVGRPLDLAEFLASNADAPDDDTLASRLKFTLAQEFFLESKAIRGPVLKGARQVVEEIMRTPPFLERLRAIAAQEGLSDEAIMQKARAMLLRMAADFRFQWLEGFALTISLVFQRLFRGVVVDTDGLDAIREAARYAPMVLVPAHRSHIDYLLLSLIFYTHGLIPPHITAGDNLAFWPMGPIFRHSGAFFIRRSVKGDALYQVVLAQYIRKLLKEGYWLEFFIEGTRSRSGKSLSPRYGILKMVVDAVASGAAPDANLVPAAITYEKVIEEKSYRAESAGREKQRESMGALARSARVLKSRYGKVYLQFDRPFSLVSFLRSQGVEVPLPPNAVVPQEVVRRLAHILVHRINHCFLVTPHQVVAFALLTHPRRGIEYERLLDRVGFLVSYLQGRGARLTDLLSDPLREMGLLDIAKTRRGLAGVAEESASEAVGFALRRAVDDVLSLWHKDKVIRIREYGDGRHDSKMVSPGEAVVSVDEEHRIALDYYKNGIIHWFVPESLLAFAVLSAGPSPLRRDWLRDRVKALSRLFKFEFIFGADEPYERIFAATLDEYLQDRILVQDGDGLSLGKDARDVLAFFAGIVMPFVEAYQVIGRVVASSAGGLSDRELIRAAMRAGRKGHSVGDIHYIEAVSAVTFHNALVFLRSEVREGRAPDLPGAARAMLDVLEGSSETLVRTGPR